MKNGSFKTHLLLLQCLIVCVGCSASRTSEQGVDGVSPHNHPYYEASRIKSLTLDELDYQQVERKLVDGVEVIIGTYTGFNQKIAMKDGSTKTIPWRQGAALFLPPKDLVNSKHVNKGVLYNGHFIFTDKIDGFSPTEESVWGFQLNQKWGVGVAKAFGIPVMIHGYEPNVVKAIEGTLYHDLQAIEFQRLLDANITNADDMPLDGRYLINGWPLAKGDMVSITAMQRLVERERGQKITEVGSLGISKEGGSHWILGAADDRVSVLAPGGSYHEDWHHLLERYRKDWDGNTASAGFPPELDQLLRAAWRLGDWITNTPAGAKVDRLISPTYWIDKIHARHILASGDLGTTEQHDRIWPLLGENRFFENLFRSHPSVRYVRAFDGSGLTISDDIGEMGYSLLPHVADLLIDGIATPTTPQVEVVESGRTLYFSASSNVGVSNTAEAVLLYTVSPERTLRRPDIKWEILNMVAVEGKPGFFRSKQLAPIPHGQSITYMVVVRERISRGSISYWRSATTMPAEHFPIPETYGVLPKWNSDPSEKPL